MKSTHRKRRGRIRQSVCSWCFPKIPLDALARRSAEIGFAGIDLVDPQEWDTLKKHGLVCTMTPSHDIAAGLNDPSNHAQSIEKIRAAIEVTAAAGFPNVVCFSGNRQPKISDDRGLRNCATAIKKVIGLAEKNKVTVCMELLNSKLNHPGYLCDRTEWGADLVHRVGSERFKLLYDVYHMQIQEGDVISTIQKYGKIIGHYHTAGVPGRHEIDETQELNYAAIFRAIAGTGFSGYIAHEFLPVGEAFAALREAFSLCNVS
jgi:hydroxypyruvate isomerase